MTYCNILKQINNYCSACIGCKLVIAWVTFFETVTRYRARYVGHVSHGAESLFILEISQEGIFFDLEILLNGLHIPFSIKEMALFTCNALGKAL